MSEVFPDLESAAGKLEEALHSIVRWSNSREVTLETMRRARCSLPLSAISLLFRISASGPVRPSQLACYYGVDNSTITPKLQRLERDGLLARQPDPLDRRAFMVHVTPAGERLCRRVRAARRAILEVMLEGQPEAEQARVAATAAQLAGWLEAKSAAAPEAVAAL